MDNLSATVLTSGSVCTFGFTILWYFIKGKFEKQNDLEEKINRLEIKMTEYISKEDHRDHREQISEQFTEMRNDIRSINNEIKQMPNAVANLIRQFLK